MSTPRPAAFRAPFNNCWASVSLPILSALSASPRACCMVKLRMVHLTRGRLDGAMPVTVVSQSGQILPPMNGGARLMQLKQEEDPQTVPCLGNTPPVSPINMEDQERIKLERKRERNRVAARKCRTRKLERISRLEDRVDELKGQNSDLSKTANNLREQVARLKQQIMEHVNGGCQLMISQNLL